MTGQANVEPVSAFPPEVVAAVLAHMNGDHAADNLLIARAFGHPEADSAVMVGLSEKAGQWQFRLEGEPMDLEVPWSKPIVQRPEIRREIVVLYDRACELLGLEPRAHD